MWSFNLRRFRQADAPSGLTLVELLVTLMIIGILSSSVLFAMSTAQEAARKSRTQAFIASLHSLIMERWESYQTRRYNFAILDEYNATGAVAASNHRLRYIRQYLKMDFPDQWTDIENISFGAVNSSSSTSLAPAFISYQQICYDFFRTNAIAKIATDTSLTTADQRKQRLEQNEGAECLYAIVMFLRGETGFGNWQKVNPDNIGDTDNDGAPEFLDGWGRPISFIRWPAGFVSDLQNGQPGSVTAADTNFREASLLDHDPFDPLYSEHCYRLVPLIVSAGPDGLFDIATIKLDYTITADRDNRWNPYYVKGGRRAGETGYDQNGNGTEDWHDNIHNHLISTR